MFQHFILSLLIVNCFSSISLASKSFPFKTKETIRLIDPKEDSLMNFQKSSDLSLIIEREQNSDPVQKHVYFYELKDIKEVRVSKKFCSLVVKRIMGPLDKSPFDLKNEEIKSFSSTGKVCVALLRDSDPQSRIREKHIYAMIKSAKTVAFVFRYLNSPGTQQWIDETQFIESLR